MRLTLSTCQIKVPYHLFHHPLQIHVHHVSLGEGMDVAIHLIEEFQLPMIPHLLPFQEINRQPSTKELSTGIVEHQNMCSECLIAGCALHQLIDAPHVDEIFIEDEHGLISR